LCYLDDDDYDISGCAPIHKRPDMPTCTLSFCLVYGERDRCLKSDSIHITGLIWSHNIWKYSKEEQNVWRWLEACKKKLESRLECLDFIKTQKKNQVDVDLSFAIECRNWEHNEWVNKSTSIIKNMRSNICFCQNKIIQSQKTRISFICRPLKLS
jgi:hypothetical protein